MNPSDSREIVPPTYGYHRECSGVIRQGAVMCSCPKPHDADDPQLEDEMACALATYAQVRAGGDLSDMITAVTTRDITPPTDPASHAFQRDQAYNTIRELLKLYDDVKLDIADALTYMDAGHHDEASEVLTKWAP